MSAPRVSGLGSVAAACIAAVLCAMIGDPAAALAEAPIAAESASVPMAAPSEAPSSSATAPAPTAPAPTASGPSASAPTASAPTAPVPSVTAPAATPGSNAPAPLVHGLGPMPGGGPVPIALRPPGATDDDGGPSPVIFGDQKIALRFNHQRHTEKLGLSCVFCHRATAKSTASADSMLPEPTTCDACHGSDHANMDAVRGDASVSGQCSFCHLGHRAEDGNRVARTMIPKPNLVFSHAAHVGRGVACQRCHGAVEKLELATRDQLPRMRACLDCHHDAGDTDGDAKGACETCHLKSGDVLQTVFSTGSLRPPSWLHGADHGPDWILRHKSAAGADSAFCATCHTEESCTECHDGRVRPRQIHPNDWLNLHSVAARQTGGACTSCHREQSFCVSCHQRAGVTLSGPQTAFGGRGRFHPPKSSWTDPPRSAGHHSWEAQRNLNACVSCHTERDCTTCHATAAVGGPGSDPRRVGGLGTSPHPAGFRGRCQAAVRKNARPCLVCHDPADPKLAECQ